MIVTVARMSAFGLGCVKTCAGEEDAELHSLLSSPDGVHQRCCFSNRQNRDKLSIRKFNFGVFTQPGPEADQRLPLVNVS
jgi:hypothetical protein